MSADLEALLRELVSIPSMNPFRTGKSDPGYGEARLAERVAAWLREAGLAAETHDIAPGRTNVAALLDGPRGAAPLLFVAHLDTVPAEGMTVPPFEGIVKEGRLYGRGACDNKGSLAAMLAALRRVAAAKSNRCPILFAGTADEESGYGGIRSFLGAAVSAGSSVPRSACPTVLRSSSSPGAGEGEDTAGQASRGTAEKPRPKPFSHVLWPPRAGVVGEPTSLRIIIAHRGVARWTLTTHGQSAHSAHPEEGINAIYRMAPLVADLAALAAEIARRPPHPLVGPPTLSVGTIHGGLSVNTVPDRCAIEVDRRLIPGESAESAAAEVAAVARRHGATLDDLFGSDPFEIAREADVVRLVSDAVRAETGQAEAVGVAYATEAPEVLRAGIPVVVFGPGEGAKAHSADESIPLDQLEAASRIYERIMKS